LKSLHIPQACFGAGKTSAKCAALQIVQPAISFDLCAAPRQDEQAGLEEAEVEDYCKM
jgi:hypothetical protein